jgi:hypothetical protein
MIERTVDLDTVPACSSSFSDAPLTLYIVLFEAVEVIESPTGLSGGDIAVLGGSVPLIILVPESTVVFVRHGPRAHLRRNVPAGHIDLLEKASLNCHGYCRGGTAEGVWVRAATAAVVARANAKAIRLWASGLIIILLYRCGNKSVCCATQRLCSCPSQSQGLSVATDRSLATRFNGSAAKSMALRRTFK